MDDAGAGVVHVVVGVDESWGPEDETEMGGPDGGFHMSQAYSAHHSSLILQTSIHGQISGNFCFINF